MKKIALVAAAAFALPIMVSHAAVITAGDLVVDMRGANLNASSTTWVNMSTSVDTVGDFSTFAVGATPALNLNVATIGGYQALFVNGNGANAVQSALPTPASLQGGSVGSVEAWLYVPGAFVADNTAVAWGVTTNSGTAYRGFRYAAGGAFNSGMFTAWFQDKNWSDPSVLLSDQWVYLTWVYDGTSILGYVNGVLKTTAPLSPLLNTSSGTMGIGSRSGGSIADAFRGYIADVRVETGILSASDVLNNFNAGIAVPEPSIFALIGVGGMMFLFRRRSRRQAA